MADLTTLADVRAALPRLASISDAEIERLIDESTSLIEGYCNRVFGVDITFTERHNPDGSGRIFLRQTPVTSITSVTTNLPGDGRVLDATEYIVDRRTGELRTTSGAQWYPSDWAAATFGSSFQSVEVVYVVTNIPAAVVGRAIAIVNRACSQLTTDPSVKSKSLGDASYTLGSAADMAVLTADDMRVLSPFKKWALA